MKLVSLEDVFDRITPEPNTGCWLWTGAVNDSGYPQAKVDARTRYVHRLAIELDGRQLGDGQQSCHACDQPSCVNPRHLSPGSQSFNLRDMVRRGRRHYARGEAHREARLTQKQVDEIRAALKVGTQRAIAARFGVHHSTISHIAAGRTWR